MTTITSIAIGAFAMAVFAGFISLLIYLGRIVVDLITAMIE